MSLRQRVLKIGMFFGSILFLSCFIFLSCEKDDNYYSLGDIWISLGMIEKTTDNSFVIHIDNGDTLVPVSNNVPYFTFEDSQRIMVNYTILDEVGQSTNKFWVKINNLYDVLLKDIIVLTETNSDSIGNNPVNIDDIWISKNYLNIEFRYLGGEKTHFINLVRQPGNITDLAQPIELELRHNDQNDTQDYNLVGFVTFNLNEIKNPELDSVAFKVKSTDFKGNEHTFNGTFHY